MPAAVPTPSRSFRIVEPPPLAFGYPTRSGRKPTKTSYRHRFRASSHFDFQHGLLLYEEEPTPVCSICLTGWIAPIGGSFHVGQTTLLIGVVPPLNNRPFSLANEFFHDGHPFRQMPAFSSSGVARRAMGLYTLRSALCPALQVPIRLAVAGKINSQSRTRLNRFLLTRRRRRY